jgi:hypothetical protein
VVASLAAALAGVGGPALLAGAALRWISREIAIWSILLVALELPLWAIAQLLWPRAPTQSTSSGALLVGVGAAVVLATLFFDGYLRALMWESSHLLEKLAVATWGFVHLAAAAASFKLSRAEAPVAFRLLLASLLGAIAGNYIATRSALSTMNLSLVAALAAASLRVLAARSVIRGT